MKNLLIKSSAASSKPLAPLRALALITLAVVGGVILWPSFASMESTHTNSAPNLALLETAIPVQNQASTFYLHGTGAADNPPTLFLNTTAPTATTEKFKDSTSISNAGGNLWKEVGTWPAAAAMTTGSLTSLSNLHVWLGLKNSDDQGTNFDLRVEAYKNSTLVASGQTLCITGVTRNPGSAKEVVGRSVLGHERDHHLQR